MKFNTALGFMLGGLTILALHHLHSPHHRQYIAQLGGLVILLIGSVTLAEILFQRDLGIDELLLNDPDSNGRMAPLSALFFVLIGIALIFLDDQPNGIVQASTSLALVGGMFGILESVYAATITRKVSEFSAIPPLTMLSYVLVTTSVLSYRIDQSRLRVIVSDCISGLVLRRLLMGTSWMILVINGIAFGGFYLDWYPVTVAYAVFTISITLVIAGQAWQMVFMINRIEAERNAVHAALVERELLYRTLFENVDDAVTVHDLDGNILEVNDSAVRRLGYSRDELLRMKTSQIDHPDYGAKFGERVAVQTREGRLDNIFGMHLSKDGRQIPIQVSSRVMTYKGQPAVIAVIHDITLLQKVQQDELELAMERARSQILTKFVQDASHEFRTPLAIILVNLSLLSRTEHPERRQMLIKRGEEQVARITKLVEQLVLITELDDAAVYELGAISVADVLKSVRSRYAPHDIQHHIIQYEIGNPSPIIQADTGKLVIALSQIIDNALRYSPDNSTIRVSSMAQDTSAIISISDAGVGIAPDEIEHIFTRFYRHDKAHTTEGFGLGLAIAKIVVKAHQGRIEVESQLGHGTTFRVILPLVGTQDRTLGKN
ncbi:MAG: hypothetical protein BroJett018_29530 [Chloroflexota bacterium]|nr:MAG: hypothetical protein BroJett018_29530 [Chloroflexota bacterium]